MLLTGFGDMKHIENNENAHFYRHSRVRRGKLIRKVDALLMPVTT